MTHPTARAMCHGTTQFQGLPRHARGPAIDTLDRTDVTPLASAIVLFRGWRLRENEHGMGLGPLLRQGCDNDWVPADAPVGRVDARCHCTRGADGNPIDPTRHQCGFYGHKEYARCAAQLNYAQNWILGICVCFGRLEETEHGYRAAHATPLALIDEQPHADDLGDAWTGVPLPILPLEDMIAYGQQYGYVHDQPDGFNYPKAA